MLEGNLNILNLLLKKRGKGNTGVGIIQGKQFQVFEQRADSGPSWAEGGWDKKTERFLKKA